MNWYRQSQVEYRGINPEEDLDESGEAEQIFRQAPLGVDRNKDISHVAVENGVVIGAIASGWQEDRSGGETEAVFSFDLAVKPEFRRRGVGLSLIQQAVKQYERDKGMYEEMGSRPMMRLWVVNRFLIPVLEQKFGFQLEAEHGNGSVHMVRY
jgi:GNAT superfamily N-acetyltransferase